VDEFVMAETKPAVRSLTAFNYIALRAVSGHAPGACTIRRLLSGECTPRQGKTRARKAGDCRVGRL